MSLFTSCLSFSVVSFLLTLLPYTAAASTNTTIDDTYGDLVTGRLPVYSSGWNVGQTCTGCAVTPMASKTYMKTWHDTTSNNPTMSSAHQVTLTFNGTAIWVYCILANFVEPSVTTASYISFELDGIPGNVYSHEPDSADDDYAYNVTVYSNTGLSSAEHTLVMTASQGENPSLVLFDWALYTSDDAVPASSGSSAAATAKSSSSSTLSPSSSTMSSSLLSLSPDVSASGISTTSMSTALPQISTSISIKGASSVDSMKSATLPSSTASASNATKTGAAMDMQIDVALSLFALLFSAWALA